MRIMLLMFVAAACSKAGSDNNNKNALATAAGMSAGHNSRDAVIDAWKDAKLTPSAMTVATVTFGKDCQGGTVEGIDVLLCSFESSAEAKSAEEPGMTWIGDTTGAAQAHGTVLLVVADRHKSDPNGRTMNRLLKLAPK